MLRDQSTLIASEYYPVRINILIRFDISNIYISTSFDYFIVQIGTLTKLVVLNLRGNCLRSIPDEIGYLIHLDELYLDGNPGITSMIIIIIIIITTVIQSLPFLNNIILGTYDSNFISALPTSIGNLKKLRILYLSNNSLMSLPNEFGELSSLRTLW